MKLFLNKAILKAEYWVLKVSSIQLKLGFGKKLARELMEFTKKVAGLHASFNYFFNLKNIFQMFAPIPKSK